MEGIDLIRLRDDPKAGSLQSRKARILQLAREHQAREGGPPQARDEGDAGGRTYTNVYLKNIPGDVADERLREVFTRHGEVVSAVVMRKPDGASKGFGFVSFREAGQARAAVEALHDSTPFGGFKKLYVGRAESKGERMRQKGSLWS
jgi:RNA recognition motif-containing protein